MTPFEMRIPVRPSKGFVAESAPALKPDRYKYEALTFKSTHVRINSAYMHEAFGDPKALITHIRNLIKGSGVQFDTLVGTGLSGALVVPTVARALRKHWAIVRKPGVSTHSTLDVEGELGKRWMFLDDMVASGASEKRVMEAVATFASNVDWQTEYVGVVVYHEGGYVRLAH